MYKVGDVVQVRRDLERGVRYSNDNGTYSDCVNTDMFDLIARTEGIMHIGFAKGDGIYYMKEDGAMWNWVDEMIEGIHCEVNIEINSGELLEFLGKENYD